MLRRQERVAREGVLVDPGTVLRGASATAAVIDTLRALVKGTRGTKRVLLLELEHNIRLILLYARGGAPIDKIIKKLEVARCQAALESDFSFKSVKRGRVSKATAADAAQLQPYVGWTTERLFASVYLKVRELQTIVEIDSGNAHFRKSVRLLNVLKLMLLLLRHLRS